MAESKIIRGSESDAIILEFQPKEFSVAVTECTTEFISAQVDSGSDFQISEVISEQVGISNLKKKMLEKKIEEEILQDLKGLEEKAYKEAYELGLIEGQKKAYDEKQQEIEQRLIVLDEFLENTQVLYKKLFNKNEKLMIDVLFSFASKIAFMEIENRPEEVINMVSKTMESLQGDIKSNVIISEEDKSFLDEIKKNITKNFEFLDKVELSTSEDLSAGSCVIETNFGIVDASVKERVDKVWQSIKEKTPGSAGDIITNE